MRTQGRYVVVIAKDWPERRFAAALGFTDSLAEACVEAHVFGSSASPVEVYDSQDIIKAGRSFDLRRVHTTAR